MVAELDAVVRILLATLQKQAELDNTIVVFTSDNGGLNAKAKQIGAFTPSQSSMRPDFSNFALVGPDSSDGLRGHKGSLHEGGHRVPLIIAWADGGVPAGATCSDFVGLHDLYATLLDLVGAPQPQHGQAVDSLSFKQRLISPESGRPARNELLVPGSNLKWALREKGLKLIGRVANNVHIATQLFDLNVDRNETHNLLNRNVQSGMLQQYVQNVHEKKHCASTWTCEGHWHACCTKRLSTTSIIKVSKIRFLLLQQITAVLGHCSDTAFMHAAAVGSALLH